MNTLKGIVTDLRHRRLWIVAVALVLALVAVPVLLSKKASSAGAVAQLPATGAPTSLATGGPAVTVDGTPAQSHLTGKGRDPFTPQNGGSKAATAPATTAAATPSAGSTGSQGSAVGGSTGSTGSATGTGSSGSGGSTPSVPSTPPSTAPTTGPATTPPATTTPPAPPQPAPAGLKANQTYRVALSITKPDGGLNRVDPLQRLSVLPSERKPLLVELGVSKGGNRVLFVVQPGTVVHGPGTCTPGPIDCELLSLGRNQVEDVSVQTALGVSPVAQFAVTGIGTADHGSAAAADKARRTASAAGRALLSKSNFKTLSLFQYDPSVGAVLDLRNLTVGGN